MTETVPPGRAPGGGPADPAAAPGVAATDLAEPASVPGDAGTTESGFLRWVGVLTCLAAAAPMVWWLLEDPARLLRPRSIAWFLALVAFVALVWVPSPGTGALCSPSRTRTWLAVHSLLGLALLYLIPNGVFGVFLVIVAGALGQCLPLRTSLVWIAVQTLAAGPAFFQLGGWLETAVLIGAFGGFQVFAAFAAHTAERERRGRQELARVNTELNATRELLAETSRTAERLRIARDLHDVMGHHLTALSLQLEAARHAAPAAVPGHVETAREVTATLLREVRQVVGRMRAEEVDGPAGVVSRAPGPGRGGEGGGDVPGNAAGEEAGAQAGDSHWAFGGAGARDGGGGGDSNGVDNGAGDGRGGGSGNGPGDGSAGGAAGGGGGWEDHGPGGRSRGEGAAAPGTHLEDDLGRLAAAVGTPRVHLDVDTAAADLARGATGEALLRCGQEMLTNAIRHSRAENLWLRLDRVDGGLVLEARDDGVGTGGGGWGGDTAGGADGGTGGGSAGGASGVTAGGAAPGSGDPALRGPEDGPGHGLLGMRERVERLGGRLRVTSLPERGFTVRAWLPLTSEAGGGELDGGAGKPGGRAAKPDGGTVQPGEDPGREERGTGTRRSVAGPERRA